MIPTIKMMMIINNNNNNSNNRVIVLSDPKSVQEESRFYEFYSKLLVTERDI
jgi:hypothetical protein